MPRRTTRTKPIVRKDAGRPSGKPQTNARSLANLSKGTPALPTLPSPTPADAATYVQIRLAGVPPDEAVNFFLPAGTRLGPAAHRRWATDWELHRHVVAAWDAHYAAKWHELSHSDRLEHAMTLHLAQLAYYLYTADFTAADANVRKMAEARDAIRLHLDALKGGDASKFDLFMRTLLQGKTSGQSVGAEPPQWRGPEPDLSKDPS